MFRRHCKCPQLREPHNHNHFRPVLSPHSVIVPDELDYVCGRLTAEYSRGKRFQPPNGRAHDGYIPCC
jgi:hypothetical protein